MTATDKLLSIGPIRAASSAIHAVDPGPRPGSTACTGAAYLIADGTYRYWLTRQWGAGPIAAVIGYNPSVATSTKDDPTVRKCVRFAREWGCGTLLMVNLYAYVSTDPRRLPSAADPVGPDNDCHLIAAARAARASNGPIVAAWGALADNPHDQTRVRSVLNLPGMTGLSSLGVTRSGAPRHPGRLPYAARLTPWPPGPGTGVWPG